MREDMFKVIVERPRRGGGYARPVPRWRLKDEEDGGPRQGPLCLRRDKELNENLSPLYRFLASRCGQHWNQVYAEVSRCLRPRNVLQEHVLVHLRQHVAIHVARRGDELWVADSTAWRGPKPLKDSFYELYVHPLSGVLLRNHHEEQRSARRRQRKQGEAARTAKRLRVLSATLQLHCLAGHWYAVDIAPLLPPPGTRRDEIRDAGLSDLPPQALYGRAGVYACGKRVLGKKELKRYGLQNA